MAEYNVAKVTLLISLIATERLVLEEGTCGLRSEHQYRRTCSDMSRWVKGKDDIGVKTKMR